MGRICHWGGFESRTGRRDELMSRVYRFPGSVPYVRYWSDWSLVVSLVGRRDGLSSQVGHRSGLSSRVSRRSKLEFRFRLWVVGVLTFRDGHVPTVLDRKVLVSDLPSLLLYHFQIVTVCLFVCFVVVFVFVDISGLLLDRGVYTSGVTFLCS